MRYLILVLFLSGCGDSDLDVISYYSNGEFVGVETGYTENGYLITFENVTYETDLETVFIRPVNYIYPTSDCSKPYVMKGQTHSNAIVDYDFYHIYYITYFEYKSFVSAYEVIDGECLLTDLKGGHVSPVYKRNPLPFLDSNLEFIYAPMRG